MFTKWILFDADDDDMCEIKIVEAATLEEAAKKIELCKDDLKEMGVGYTFEELKELGLEDENHLSITGLERHLVKIESETDVTVKVLSFS